MKNLPGETHLHHWTPEQLHPNHPRCQQVRIPHKIQLHFPLHHCLGLQSFHVAAITITKLNPNYKKFGLKKNFKKCLTDIPVSLKIYQYHLSIRKLLN